MSVASNKEELRLKIVFIGPSYAGKTSLLNRVARNDFNDKYLATIGCDFLSKVYNLYGRKFRAQFWDTAGQERFGTISKIYFRDADAILLCYSLNDANSLKGIEFWLEELNRQKVDLNQSVFAVVGCKKDLDINAPTDAVLDLLKSRVFLHFDTSAKTAEGVDEMMKAVIEESAMRKMRKLEGELKQNQLVGQKLNNDRLPDSSSKCSC